MSFMPTNQTGQTDLETLRRRLALAETIGATNRQGNTPIGTALYGLAQVLSARNANKLAGEVAGAEQAQRADSYAKLGSIMEALNEARQSGQPIPPGLMEQAGQIADPQIAGLAAALYGRAMEPAQAMERKTYTDPTGIVRYRDDGSPLPGQEGYDDSVLVTPQERLEVRQQGVAARQRANELDAERNAITREQEERQRNKLSSTAEKALDQATAAAIEAGQSRFELEALANDYDALDPASGLSARWQESLKSITGSEDAVSVMRTRYAKLRNSEAVKNLPPGVASDRDIALALEGFLPATANPKEVASFLRGLAKMSAFDEAFNVYKARYIDEKSGIRGLLDAWRGSDELADLRAGMTAKSGKETVLVNDVEVEIVE